MSYAEECVRSIKQHYQHIPADVGALRSAYADAAHLCDAIAKDIIESGRKDKRKPCKAVRDLAEAVTLAGNAIFAVLCSKHTYGYSPPSWADLLK